MTETRNISIHKRYNPDHIIEIIDMEGYDRNTGFRKRIERNQSPQLRYPTYTKSLIGTLYEQVPKLVTK